MSNYLPWFIVHFVCLVLMYGHARDNEPVAAIYFFTLIVLAVTVPRRKAN